MIRPSRRVAFLSLLVLVLVGALLRLLPSWMPPPDVSREELVALHDQLVEMVHDWAERGEWAREDGFIYAVDVGQLMSYAARSRDRELYDSLRTLGLRELVRADPEDPYTDGFVAWRRRVGNDADASGTTEALRLVEGFLEGAAAFGEEEDRQWAHRILEGYSRHATVDQDIWMIRNYFNLGTRAFSVNSFLVDYDVDLLARVAKTEPAWSSLAANCEEVVMASRSPCGLFYDVIQPELKTLMPELEGIAFSPNDIAQLSNSATVAERLAGQRPERAREVLEFARARIDNLGLFYRGRSGERVGVRSPGVETYAPLVRLASTLGESDCLRAFIFEMVDHVRTFVEAPSDPKLYVASEALSALQVVLAQDS